MKIFLDTIGCRLNLAEIENFARQFQSAGHIIVATAGEADLAVINTCTVTSEAASDSRAAIRRAYRSGIDSIIATGCLTTIEPIATDRLPGVNKIVPNRKKDVLVREILGFPQNNLTANPRARVPIPGLHSRTRAFIKVQDGCNNSCTYCITTIARGTSRSRSVTDIQKDVDSALRGGSKEIIITGVHLAAWGQDYSPKKCLHYLVSQLLSNASIPRLRLSSLEPWNINDEFFDLFLTPTLCRHLHLPLQSGSPSVLARMKRNITPTEFEALVKKVRERIPAIAISTDIIVGFPGETDAEFAETLDFVHGMEFSSGHVFTYSARPGTAAAKMPNQIHGNVSNERGAILRGVISASGDRYRRNFLSQNPPVLWESACQVSDNAWKMEGLTDNNLRVTAVSRESRWNQFDNVRLTNVKKEVIEGIIIGGQNN